jgi:hypothetical protein
MPTVALWAASRGGRPFFAAHAVSTVGTPGGTPFFPHTGWPKSGGVDQFERARAREEVAKSRRKWRVAYYVGSCGANPPNRVNDAMGRGVPRHFPRLFCAHYDLAAAHDLDGRGKSGQIG